MQEVKNVDKVVLAYSGGLDTSVAIHWMKERFDCEVIAYCADVGQEEDLEGARQKALDSGADKAIVDNLTDEFVEDYVFPAFRAGAIYEEQYLLGTSLARPCITKGLMDVVKQEGADAVAHGATGKGNDQVRFELAAYHFQPTIKILGLWRMWEFRGRAELIEYTKKYNIPIEASADKPYSIDRNLLHTSCEGGILEDPWTEADESIFSRTTDPLKAPAEPEYLTIDYVAGTPVAVNGESLPPTALLTKLNSLAGRHGVGRVDIVENRFVGMKSRGVYETPGGTLIFHGRRAVESLSVDREVMRLRSELVPKYASLLYNGFWFAPEREALQKLFDDIAEKVTGTARLKLYRGSVTVVGRKAERSLYRPNIVTFEADDIYDQADADGFIRLNALRLRIRSGFGDG